MFAASNSQKSLSRWLFYAYILLILVFTLGPLVIVTILAFNNNPSASFPWQGFTLDWFKSSTPDRVGLFDDARMMAAVVSSVKVAVAVTLISVILGVNNAFLFVREKFVGKEFLYMLMLGPLVVPGVVLGTSILAFSHGIANALDSALGNGAGTFLRPGFWLVVLGQVSFVATTTTLVITARLKRFDLSLEEAAMDLGATRSAAVLHVTLRFLGPAIFGAAIIAFLFSFENFNTTYFLSGPDPTVPIILYSRLRFGISPEINAVSVLMMVTTGLLGLAASAFQKEEGLA
ncbi:MAG TPA: ABC transporter permease [Chloroflexi bacterium]|nr:ABC transporter permease [Chloroflexota bacterium]